MIINSLELINFRQFKHESIKFATDSNNPITIIVGDNTGGKTTLINAFLWCLYKVNNFEGTVDERYIINADVLDSLVPGGKKESVKVVLNFNHNGINYKLTTTQEYKKTYSGIVDESDITCSLVKSKNGSFPTIIPQNKIDFEISNILAEPLKDYFFFDGEHNKIDNIAKKSNLKSSVSDLIGLKKYEMIVDYFNPNNKETVTTKFRNRLEDDDSGKLDMLQDSLLENQKKLMDSNEEITIYDKDIEEIKIQQKAAQKIIDDNISVKEDQDKLKKLYKSLDEARKSRDENFDLLIKGINATDKDINTNPLVKILYAYANKKFDLNKLINNSSFKSDDSLSHISEEVVDELVKRGRCICGTLITNNSEAYNHLMESKQHMEPHDFGKYAGDFVASEENNCVFTKSMTETITKKADDLISAIIRIDEYKDEIKKIEDKIAGCEDVGKYQEAVNSFKQQIDQKQGAIEYIKDNVIPKLESNINELRSQIETCSSKNVKNNFINECISYCDYIYSITLKKLNNNRKMLIERLTDAVNSVFVNLYNYGDERKIIITDNFETSSVLKTDKKLGKSTGLGTIENYSFVLGLMKLAKEKIMADSFIDESEEREYPLVMDAPFSNLDEKHISNICNNLTRYVSQSIIMVMKKDYVVARPAFEKQMGKKYNIVKISESESKIEEV